MRSEPPEKGVTQNRSCAHCLRHLLSLALSTSAAGSGEAPIAARLCLRCAQGPPRAHPRARGSAHQPQPCGGPCRHDGPRARLLAGGRFRGRALWEPVRSAGGGQAGGQAGIGWKVLSWHCCSACLAWACSPCWGAATGPAFEARFHRSAPPSWLSPLAGGGRALQHVQRPLRHL